MACRAERGEAAHVSIVGTAGREVLERFALSHDPQYLAEGAVLEGVGAAGTLRGRPAISAFLRLLFYRAFADAHLTVRGVAFDEERGIGLIEWSFSGRSLGDLIDLPAGLELSVPVGAVCEVGPDGIRRSRVYVGAAFARRHLAT